MRDINTFIDALSRWYLRRSRRRFWKSRNDDDKLAAYQTLWECLVTAAKVIAPVIPFASERMYQGLVRYYDSDAPVSIHLCDFPEPSRLEAVNDTALLQAMDAVLGFVEQGHAARNKAGLKVRQPLGEARFVTSDKGLPEKIAPFLPLIRDELNIRQVTFVDSADDLCRAVARIDARSGKPKYGRLFQALQTAVEAMRPEQIAALQHGQPVQVRLGNQDVDLAPEDVIIEKAGQGSWEVAEGNGFLVAICAALNEDLIREGLVRDLVRHVQNLRKQIGLEVSDRIRIEFSAGDPLAAAVLAHSDYLAGETLALEIEKREAPIPGAHQVKLGDTTLAIAIHKCP
jgi:isoleucyl-tRNA synthetase